MKIFKHFKDLENELANQKGLGKTIGFVPTMGALHNGHISLIQSAKQKTDFTVSSIFVNPTQFNNKEDLLNYPRNVERDLLLVEHNGGDVVFLPSVNEIYPNGLQNVKHFDLGELEFILEGKFRPGHFQGVCMVVERLLSRILPDYLFLGQKDFQQCMVISKLVKDMGIETKINICPTLRENSGLAMSSRNERLSMEERGKAAQIFRSLQFIKRHIKEQTFENLKRNAITQIEQASLRVEYLELANLKSLEITNKFNAEDEFALLIAAYLGEVRLIDNLLI